MIYHLRIFAENNFFSNIIRFLILYMLMCINRMLCVGALIAEADVDDNKLMEFSEFKKIMGQRFTPSRKGELHAIARCSA